MQLWCLHVNIYTVVMHIAVTMMQTITVSLTDILYIYDCHFFQLDKYVNNEIVFLSIII